MPQYMHNYVRCKRKLACSEVQAHIRGNTMFLLKYHAFTFVSVRILVHVESYDCLVLIVLHVLI
jgi:hypothetical protein